VFSANSGRGLSFEDVSPDLMGSVDVYKTPSADMVEGGIAGIVDLRTRKPLDSKGFLAISADWNYADQRKTGFFSGNAVLSHRWDVDGVEVGLLLPPPPARPATAPTPSRPAASAPPHCPPRNRAWRRAAPSPCRGTGLPFGRMDAGAPLL
jgi:hypothetical protein